MIAVKTPLRVSLFGGGTDIPDYFKEYGGQVTGFTINKYIHIFASKIDIDQGFKIRLSYKSNEDVLNIEDIQHPIYREVLKLYDFDNMYHFSTMSCLPSGAGLGSSSSFTVGLIKTLNSILGINESKLQIAKKAISIERDILKESGGWQDQLHAAFGGINTFKFNNNSIDQVNLEIDKDSLQKLNNSMYILHTGITRKAKDIEKGKINNINFDLLKATHELAIEGESYLHNSKKISMNEIGLLLNEGWKIKRSLSEKVSNSNIDDIYNIIIENGAYGAKLCGAGGGGFFLVLSSSQSVKKIRENLPKSVLSKVRIDFHGIRHRNI